MSFEVNLVKLRKEKGLSQEQLADMLEVSRQTIYKWETGQSYPELDRLILISNLFNCSIDELVKKEVNTVDRNLKEKYNTFNNKFSLFMALGVSLIILGLALMLLLLGLRDLNIISIHEIIPVIIFLSILIISISFFIIYGLRQEDIKKEITDNSNFYTSEEVKSFNSKFAIAIATGVSLIFLGIIAVILFSEVFVKNGFIASASMLFFVGVSVFLFVYFGCLKEKFSSLKDTKKTKKTNKLIDKITSVIMLLATLIFLYLGFVHMKWHPGWVVFPIGGILCGIVSVILEEKE